MAIIDTLGRTPPEPRYWQDQYDALIKLGMANNGNNGPFRQLWLEPLLRQGQ